MKYLILAILLSACSDNSQGRMPWDCDRVTHEDDARPDIFVIGDSISSNYQPHIEAALPAYDIIESPCNGGNTRHGIHKVETWLAARPSYDVITFNHGMWDVSNNGQFVPLEEYRTNLRFIGEVIKTKTARPYFVLTTFTPSGQSLRPNSRVIEYNNAAIEVMNDIGIPVIDLYTPSINFERINNNLGNDVHYTSQGGYDLAQVILGVLNL